MDKSSIFDTPEILRRKWTDFEIDVKSEKIRDNIDMVSDMLITIMDTYKLQWLSPQNVRLDNFRISEEDFYKNIIVLRDFDWEEFVELLNPSYEIVSSERNLLFEESWNIETTDDSWFWVFNLVPSKIRLKWFTKKWELTEGIVEAKNMDWYFEIWNIIKLINHLEWRVISDWSIIRQLVKWDKKLSTSLSKHYPNVIPSFLEFTGKEYIIHNIWDKWLSHPCFPKIDSKKWDTIVPFHFDLDEDFPFLISYIYKWWKEYNISLCKKCFDN